MLKIDKIFSLVSNFVNDGDLESNSKKKKVMMTCIENVIQEIALDYSSCVYQEKILLSKGERFTFDKLSKTIVNMRKLYKDGYATTFKLFNDGVEVDNGGEYVISYNYLPFIDFDAEVVVGFSPCLTERVVAYGVAAEYLLNEGRYEEASLWDSRFREGVRALTRPYRKLILKKRAWF